MKSESEGEQQRSRCLAAGALAIVLLTVAVYLPVLPGSFLMDDARLTGGDNALVNGDLTPYSIWFRTDFTLAAVGWWLEHLAFGPNPAGYHIVNILLHAASGIFLWRLLARLKIPGAWLAGALYAVHPVCVNSVARIAELKNTLSMQFFLLSFIGYLHYESTALYPAETTRRTPNASFWYVFALMAFVLALLAKTSVVMLPVVILLGALWQRGRIAWKDVLHTLPFFVLALAFGLMSVWFQKNQALPSADLPLPPSSFLQRLAGAGYVFWFYLGKALVPINLTIQYVRWKMDAGAAVTYLPGVLAVAAVGVCLLFYRGWGRHVFFGLAVFAVMLFPAMGFFDAQFLTVWLVSDHLQYAALAAIVALVSAGVAALPNRNLFYGIGIMLVLGSSVLCFEHARAFRTLETLMADTIAKNPQAAGAYNDMGIIFAKRGDISRAMDEFRAGIKCDPNSVEVLDDLGLALATQGKYAESEAQYQAALKLHPNDAVTHKMYASLLKSEGKNAEAVYHLQMAVIFDPDVKTFVELAELDYAMGNFHRAAADLRHALTLKTDPSDAMALNNLAWILATCPDDSVRNGREAVQCAKQACQMTSYKEAGMVGTLAAAYAEAGNFPDAIATAEMAADMAQQEGNTQFATLSQQLIQLFRAGKAYRQASSANGPR